MFIDKSINKSKLEKNRTTMANIIFKVITIDRPRRLTNKDMGKRMTEIVLDERRKMSETKEGGAFQNSHVRYVHEWWLLRKPKYEIILTFLSFS
jgi:hypothetical protein